MTELSTERHNVLHGETAHRVGKGCWDVHISDQNATVRGCHECLPSNVDKSSVCDPL